MSCALERTCPINHSRCLSSVLTQHHQQKFVLFPCLNSSAHSVQLRSQWREEHPFLRLSVSALSVSLFLFDNLTTFCMPVLTPFCQWWLLPLLLVLISLSLSFLHSYWPAAPSLEIEPVLWAWGARVLRNDHRRDCSFNLVYETKQASLLVPAKSIETGNWVAPSERVASQLYSHLLSLCEWRLTAASGNCMPSHCLPPLTDCTLICTLGDRKQQNSAQICLKTISVTLM